MRIQIIAASLLCAAASVGATSPARADPSGTPVVTGCPAGYALRSVVEMERTGPYYLPRLVDEAGNSNGLVCAKPQPDSVRDKDCRAGGEVACLLQKLGLPHYLFKDDDNPALKNGV